MSSPPYIIYNLGNADVMEKKCDKKLIERVRVLRARNIIWEVIAKVVGVARTSLSNYKDPESESYNEQFAAMAKETQENIDCGEIKAGQFEQAQKHKLVKVTTELRDVGPKMPPSWFPKDYLVDYADQFLDLELYMSSTAKEMRAECFLRVQELSKEKFVKVKTEEAQVDPNLKAVENVLKNAGKEDERWNVGQDVKISTDDPLTQLLAQIGDIKKGLPEAGEIPDYDTD
jgi:hypothetical protein